MMRRMIWLAAGAVLGVLGYRRAERLVRGARPRGAPRRAIAAAVGRMALGRPTPRPSGLGRAALDRRAQRPLALGAALRGRRATAEVPGATSGFIRDVRDGMDEYLNRHASQLGNTL